MLGPFRRTLAIAALAALGSVTLGPQVPAASAQDAPASRGTAIACPPGEAPPTGFTDPLGPFAEAVRCLVGHDVARGRDASTFDVNAPVTRAQLASLTHGTLAAASSAPAWDGRHRFSDVARSGTHVAQIGALAGPTATADGAILRGFGDGTFGPGDPITRQQAASTIDRAITAALPDLRVPTGSCRFADADTIVPVHRDASRRLCALGIAQGRDDGRFVPAGTVTRGQAAAFLARTLDLLAEAELVDSPFAYEVEVVVDGLEAPWEVVRTADDRWFVTERVRGRVLELVDGRPVVRRTFTVDSRNSNGLLGLAAEPDGDRLYAYLTTATDNRVVRFDPDGGAVEPVLTGLPKGSVHAGGRLTFGPDGMLYVSTGDVTANGPSGDQERLRAQDPQDLAGKVLRITPDGDVPGSAPFGNEVWALGFRNVQGLSFDDDGRLWGTDFGHTVDDEVNRVVAGGNYGWPHATGTQVRDGSRPAAFVRQPAAASWSGLTVVREDVGFAAPGDLLVGALRGERLWHLRRDGDRIVSGRSLLTDHVGRVRTVVDVGDGAVYLLTDNAIRGLGPFRGDALLRVTLR